jgi:pimeloyl-[acyl-carrier protein] methyl ester esterase
VSLHVERAGTGPDLVLLHGWAMHSGAWADVAPALAERFRIHLVDLPGHGRSAAHTARGFEDAVDAVAEVVPEGAIACGWSLGALLAQRLASHHGLRALVLVGATPCFAQRPDWPHAMKPETLAEFARGLESEPRETLARFVRLNALHGERGREAIRAFVARLEERGAPALDALQRSLAWLCDVDLRAEAAAIRAPVTVVHGDRDMLVPAQAGRWLARTLPRATLVEIAGAAHLPFFTHRAAFLAAMDGLDA